MDTFEEIFFSQEQYAIKWKKYFQVYDKIFSKYRGKEITFVEIGVFEGGSLEIWKRYFGEKARIIGIDLNPECKKFENPSKKIEIFIGNQSDPNFWDEFFLNLKGSIDVVLDDGGHTNLDQIITSVKVLEKINDDGILVVEDVHTSYVEKYNSSKKYSFINFAKKIIDDLNSNIDQNLDLNFSFSLKNHVYSVEFFEGIVVFYVDRKKTFPNSTVSTSFKKNFIEDLTWSGNEINIKKIKNFLKKIPFVRFNKFNNFLNKKINNSILKKFFK